MRDSPKTHIAFAKKTLKTCKELYHITRGLDIPRLTSANQNEIKIKGYSIITSSSTSQENNTNVSVTITNSIAPIVLSSTENLNIVSETTSNLTFTGNVFWANKALEVITQNRTGVAYTSARDPIVVEVTGMGQYSWGGELTTHKVLFVFFF